MPSKRNAKRKIWILRNAKRNERIRLRRKERQRRRSAAFAPMRVMLSGTTAANGAGERTLAVPEALNLITDYQGACRFFTDLRATLSDKRLRQVTLDHRAQRVITPEAALLLIAELNRAHIRNPEMEKKCRGPSDPTVCWILQEVGYFKYFPALRYSIREQPRHCLQHLNDRSTKGTKVKRLIEHFEQRVTFTPEGRKALYDALVESMNNVAEHAYPARRENRKAYGEWWLVGYFDDSTCEISFSFFDQGIGIPRSIRTRFRDTLLSGTALIRDAVEHGRSSTQLDTRGKGLPSLKKFVDASIAGTLVINSHESQCIFKMGESPIEQTWDIHLPGTLISWNIQIEPSRTQQ